MVQVRPEVKLDREDGTAEITVTIDHPDPHGIAENTVLYGFEEADVQKQRALPGRVQGDQGRREAEDGGAGSHLAVGPAQIERLAMPSGRGNSTRSCPATATTSLPR